MFLNALVGDAGRSTHSLQEYATTSHFTNQRSDVKGISIEGRLKKKKKSKDSCCICTRSVQAVEPASLWEETGLYM